MYHFIKLVTLFLFCSIASPAQDIETILEKARIKINQVNDYQASGKMKTNVAFLKVPVANITVYFKKPNKLKLKSEKGVSFIPKGAVSINMNSLLESDRFTIIDAGTEKINNVMMRVAKLLPLDDNSDVVLSTVYIDPSNFVICKAKTTTRENGTYELVMTYGKYIAYGLPDRIVFSFNTRDYKLPKGVTFDFDDGSEKKKPEDLKNKKGKAEIDFNSYIINKGVPDNIF